MPSDIDQDLSWMEEPGQAESGVPAAPDFGSDEPEEGLEEGLLTTASSSLVVNDFTGEIKLHTADGNVAVLSDKVTSGEKVEIMMDRIGELPQHHHTAQSSHFLPYA